MKWLTIQQSTAFATGKNQINKILFPFVIEMNLSPQKCEMYYEVGNNGEFRTQKN
jgi:hypothetical protein